MGLRLVNALLVLALAAPAGDALERARGWLRLKEPLKALSTLREAGLGAPDGAPAQRALLGLAATGAGERELATRAFQGLRSVDLPPLARLAVDARLLGVCTGCAVRPTSTTDFLAAPPNIQARYLAALANVDADAAGTLARALLPREPWRDDTLPSHERAELLSAVYTALELGGQRQAADALVLTAWQLFAMEPAVGYLVRPLGDDEMIKRHGVAAGLAHLDGLSAANRNHEVIALGTRMCRNGVVKGSKVCPALGGANGCRAAFAVGKALRQRRKYADAERTLATVAESCPELAERALYLGARAAMAQKGGGPRAIALLEKLAARYPRSNLADDAVVLAGETSARIDDAAAATRYWERATVDFPDGDMVGQAAWWLAWSALEGQRHDEATARLTAITQRVPGADQAVWRRAVYWRARQAKDPAVSIGGMEELLRKEPLSFEAALARGFLRRQGTGVPALPPVPAISASVGKTGDALADAGAALARLAMDDDAAALMRASLSARTRDAGLDPVDLDVVQLLLDAGDASSASRWIRKAWREALQGAPTTKSARVWRLAYPLAHREAIEAAARDSGVPAALLFALAREESAFDHAVTSPSGAVGLLQLVPPTALIEAMSLKIELRSEAELRDPAINARLGAAYLMRNLRQFHGNVALALAAYNAGPGSVHKWLKADPEAPLDLFIERIPIAETRDYVKRVLESYGIYRVLHGDGAPLELPARAADNMVPIR